MHQRHIKCIVLHSFCVLAPLFLTTCNDRDPETKDPEKTRPPTFDDEDNFPKDDDSLITQTKTVISKTIPAIKKKVEQVENTANKAKEKAEEAQEKAAEASRRAEETQRQLELLQKKEHARDSLAHTISTWLIWFAVFCLCLWLLWTLSRFFFRSRGMLLRRRPLALFKSLEKQTSKKNHEDSSHHSHQIQVEKPAANAPVNRLNNGDPDATYLIIRSNFQRFPNRLESRKLKWQGLWWLQVFRQMRWSWIVHGKFEINLTDPLMQTTTIRLQPEQHLTFDPRHLIGYESTVHIASEATPSSRRLLFTGLPRKFAVATGPGHLVLASRGGMEVNHIYQNDEKPLNPAALVGWSGSVTGTLSGIPSPWSNIIANTLVDCIHKFPLFGIIPFLNIGNFITSCMRYFIAPQAESPLQLTLSAGSEDKCGEVLVLNAPQANCHSGFSSYSHGGNPSLIQINLINT